MVFGYSNRNPNHDADQNQPRAVWVCYLPIPVYREIAKVIGTWNLRPHHLTVKTDRMNPCMAPTPLTVAALPQHRTQTRGMVQPTLRLGLSTLIKAIKLISPRHPHRPIYLEDSSLKFPGDSNCSNLTALPITLNTQILNEVRMLCVIWKGTKRGKRRELFRRHTDVSLAISPPSGPGLASWL